MSDPTATNRFIAFETPLGADKVLILKFDAVEEISRIPIYYLECASMDRSLSFDGIMGKNVTFSIETADGAWRYWNGYVTRFAHMATSEVFARYRIEVAPWLWFLTRSTDCRIFQDMTAAEIIADVFRKHGFSDFSDETQRTFRKREYCTQYRETACNFVMRLMEEEGVFFFFRHESGKHTLVMADNPTSFAKCPNQSKVRMDYGMKAGMEGEDSISRWTVEQSYRTGRTQLNDFNFEQPNVNLQANSESVINQGGNQNWEFYDYPGGYGKKQEGEDYALLRMEEEETTHETIAGEGAVRSFAAGFTFALSAHDRGDQNREYVITSVQHHAEQGAVWGGLDLRAQYDNRFSCVPKPTKYRAASITPKPRVGGSQTAIVTGPAGEEIWVDKYGRVKVQFHWDRAGQYDEKSSCWVRVAQIWAGKNWGAIFNPRIGQEVIVDFLEGDPDRPLVTGRVYNAEHMPPYSLPAESTKTAIKSRSSKGGGGFNEIRLEDKKGSEQFFLHAEKDMHERVKNESFETILKNRHLIVNKDQMEQVDGDKHLTVKGDQAEKITGTFSRTSQNVQQKVQQNVAIDAGMEIHLKAGISMVLEAGTSLTLKVGGNFINISPAGVAIQGTMVLVNSGGAAGSGSGASPDSPKAPTEADNAEPGQKAAMPPPKQPPRPSTFSPQATALVNAAATGVPFCEICQQK